MSGSGSKAQYPFFVGVTGFGWPGLPLPLGIKGVPDNARFLAKRGVNIVRWHGQICSKNEDSQITDIDTQAREELWQYVAAMKKEGIYMMLSPYYAMPTKPQPKWGVPYEGTDMHAMLFFNPKLQSAYKRWLRAIFEPTNPYTGIALKDESAVAIIQLQNEDSLLFWTIGNLKGKDLDLLCRQYGLWLEKKYGSLKRAYNEWDNSKVDGDNLAGGIVRFCHIWEMTQPQKENSGRGQRLADQTQFWTETMYRFNSEMARFLREEIGAKQLINPSNWKTADSVKLNDAERYSYTANEVMAVNSYYNGGEHIGQNSGWAIVNGDRFTNRSVLFEPRSLPLNIKQVAHHPMLITESSWVPPLGYQSEGPFLVISDILPLDTLLERKEKGDYTLHHHIGTLVCAYDYQPLTTVIDEESTLKFSPPSQSGRPLREVFPYFNLEWSVIGYDPQVPNEQYSGEAPLLTS